MRREHRKSTCHSHVGRTASAALAIGLASILPGVPAIADDAVLESARSMGVAFAEIARNSSPAVVFIEVEKTMVPAQAPGVSPFGDEPFRWFFGPHAPGGRMPERHLQGQGSGFIVSDDGYVVTNHHVVDRAQTVTVKLADGREFQAELVGSDAPTDIAVLKIDAHDLPTLTFGNTAALQVGEWVLALGNPFGLSGSLTAGIVSATGRSSIGLTDYEDFIQTDAAINPGNSGGPLINLDGEVIGINTAIFSRSGGYMGIGFAIPSDLAHSIMDQLIETGSVTRGFLGIVIQDLTPDLAQSLGVEGTDGILISDVTEGSPAGEAGLKQGDVILKLNGSNVRNKSALRNEVALMKPGSRADLDLRRGQKELAVSVTIGTRPGDEDVAGTLSSDFGLQVTALTPQMAREFGYVGEPGVVISGVETGSPAARAGLRSGQLIKEVNRKPVRSADDFRQMTRDAATEGRVLLLVMDGSATRFVVLKR